MSINRIDINVDALNLELTRELYLSVHNMLVVRLFDGQDSPAFLEAMNRVITAHDTIANRVDADIA